MSNLSPDYDTGRAERPPCRRRQWARVRGQQDGAGNTPVFRVKALAGQDYSHGASANCRRRACVLLARQALEVALKK